MVTPKKKNEFVYSVFKSKISEEYKLRITKNSFLNKSCLVLCSGPSLNDYDIKTIENFAKDKIVFCVKDTILQFYNIANFHIVNDGRYPGLKGIYDKFKDIKATKIYSYNYKKYFGKNDLFDLKIPEYLDPNSKNDLNNSLLSKKNFEDFLFENRLDRPWGPGILFEIVFYLIIHFGISKVFILGWDSSLDENDRLSHFTDEIIGYEDITDFNFKESKNFKKSYIIEMPFVRKEAIHFINYLNSKSIKIFNLAKNNSIQFLYPHHINLNV